VFLHAFHMLRRFQLKTTVEFGPTSQPAYKLKISAVLTLWFMRIQKLTSWFMRIQKRWY